MSKKNEYGYCAKCKKELTQMGALLWDNSGVVCSKCDMELMIVPNLKTYYAGTTFSSSHKKTKLTLLDVLKPTEKTYLIDNKEYIVSTDFIKNRLSIKYLNEIILNESLNNYTNADGLNMEGYVNKKIALIPMTEEEEYKNAGITKEEATK